MMTNREKLSKMSDEELAEWMCDNVVLCFNCVAREICVRNDEHANGLKRWLREESKDDND